MTNALKFTGECCISLGIVFGMALCGFCVASMAGASIDGAKLVGLISMSVGSLTAAAVR